MSFNRFLAGLPIFCLLLSTSCSSLPREQFGSAAIPTPPQMSYFGQPTPGTTAVLFAPGIVSTDSVELNGVFAPAGREFFFARRVNGVYTMYRSVVESGEWSVPHPLLLFLGQSRAPAMDMAVSPDGRELYFLGVHTHEYSPESLGPDLGLSRREDGAWSEARVVPPPVSTPTLEIYPVVVADGSLYFVSDRPGGFGLFDLYNAQRRADGSFAEPVNVGPPINSEFGTGGTFVAPDASYLIFSSERPGGFGDADIYVSFRQEDGSWGEPINLGEGVNSDQHEYCPIMTPDGRYLFFSRRVGPSMDQLTAGAVYWMDAGIINRLRR